MEVYGEILDAIFEKTKDVGQKTAHSVFQNFKQTKEYYDNMQPPFEKLTVDNAITKSGIFRECKVCGLIYSNAGGQTRMCDHVRRNHLFVYPYVCPIFDQKFQNHGTLIVHTNRSHIIPDPTSIIYIEDSDTKNLAAVRYEDIGKKDELKITQMYYIIWMKNIEGVDVPVDLSIDMTTFKDVRKAAAGLWTTNKWVAKSKEKDAMAAVIAISSKMAYGLFFKPEEATPFNIFGASESEGATLKWFLRIKLDANCHQQPKDGLNRTITCQNQILAAVATHHHKFPEKIVITS